MEKKEKKVFLILHNIRSVYNVGAIFRTADAAGVNKIFLTGYTPTPLDRFSRARKDLAKTALGAEKNVPWVAVKDPLSVIKSIKKDGVQIIALEQSEKSSDYKKIKTRGSFGLVVGNEVGGISKNILKKCDKIAEIPMKGKKESLNVSVAMGIALFRMLNL